ncbi:hypothetical protein J7L18_10645 [Candidatus Bathyarchaeota archaeon]|nr:hypothetical protein [Candidatus Bathyarchaeota archaeon]
MHHIRVRNLYRREDESVRRIKCSTADPNVPEEARKGGYDTSEYHIV